MKQPQIRRRVAAVFTALGLALGALAVSTDAVSAASPQLTWFNGTFTATKNAYARPTDASPADFTSPVNYAAGRVYWRLQVTSKPSNKPMLFQICMWRHTPGKTDYRYETCSAEAAMPVSTNGTSYADLGIWRNWWTLPTGWDWTKKPDVVRIMIKDAGSKRLMMSTVCGSYCYTGSDIDQHVPITMTTSVVVVPPDGTFQAPSGWSGCPSTWGGGCGGSATTTTAATTTTTTNPGTTTTTTNPGTTTTTNPGTTTTTAATTTTTTTPVSGKRIVVIGGTTNASGDRPMVARLRALGHTVTVVDDDALSSASLNGAHLVVVSSSVVPSKVPSWLATTAVPLFVNEAYAMKALRLGTAGADGNGRFVDILAATHPAASGLSGRIDATSATATVSLTKPVSGATVVARHAGSSTSAALFVVNRGGALSVGTAPAKRVGFFFAYPTPGVASAEGWALFDGAIGWALS